MCVQLVSPEGLPVLVAVASDGAGSAVAAADGAQMACQTFVAVVTKYVERGELVSQTSSILANQWLESFRDHIQKAACEASLTPRDFACTLLAVVVSPDGSMFMQVGDGAIVVRDATSDEYDWVFWPQSGEYANTTYFATDPLVAEYLQIDQTTRAVEDVALFTDGLQPLVLNYATKTAHTPFFHKVFHVLRSAVEYDPRVLSQSLRLYLDTDAVNDRTDDDKTLVLATRLLVSPYLSE
jgi:hypothetical protein